ncbi:hypothetical protein H632_c1423p1, partial [Helicosporidium sp. ATCC 50920]
MRLYAEAGRDYGLTVPPDRTLQLEVLELAPELELEAPAETQSRKKKKRRAAASCTMILMEHLLSQVNPRLLAPSSAPDAIADLDWAAKPREAFFELALPSSWECETPDPVGLTCRLFRYQRRALSWMLWREGAGSEGAETEGAACLSEPEPNSTRAPPPDAADSSKARLAALSEWPEVSLPSGLNVRYNVFRGSVLRVDWAGEEPPRPPFVRGGLLADEMGLGKTVEIVALTLAHPPPAGWKQEGKGGNVEEEDEKVASILPMLDEDADVEL